MDEFTATEIAYKNGYDEGLADGSPKWIPVTERLPKEDGKYLVNKNLWGTSVIATHHFAKKGESVCAYDLKGYKNVWYSYDSETGYFPLDHVTHWMPLPKPPKGD